MRSVVLEFTLDHASTADFEDGFPNPTSISRAGFRDIVIEDQLKEKTVLELGPVCSAGAPVVAAGRHRRRPAVAPQ